MADRTIRIKIEQEGKASATSTAFTSGKGGFSSALKSMSSMFSKGSQGPSGAIGAVGMIATLGKTLGVVALALGVIVGLLGMIFSSSSTLQKTIGVFFKMIMFVLRPIGDMLSVLFIPLIMLLKPLALFINALFRPFIQEARKAFTIGTKFFLAGDKENSQKAYFAGLELMLLPFIKIFVIAIGEGLKASIDIILAPATLFMNILGGIGSILANSGIPGFKQLGEGILGAVSAAQEGMEAFKEEIRNGMDLSIGFALDGLDNFATGIFSEVETLGALAAKLDETIGPEGTFKRNTDLAMTTMDTVGKKFVDIANQANDALDKVKKSASEAQSILSSMSKTKLSIEAFGIKLGYEQSSSTKKQTADDLIISKGKTYKTSDTDSIVATRDFSKLGGGKKIEINIGTVYTQNIDEFKRKLDQLIVANIQRGL